MKITIWLLFVVLVLSQRTLAQDSVYFSLGENYALKIRILDSLIQSFSEYECNPRSKILYSIQILDVISNGDTSVYHNIEDLSQVKYLISSHKNPCLIKGKEYYIIATSSIDKRMLYLSRAFENNFVFLPRGRYSISIIGLDMPNFKLNGIQKIHWRIQVVFSQNKDVTRDKQYKKLIKKHKNRLAQDPFLQYINTHL